MENRYKYPPSSATSDHMLQIIFYELHSTPVDTPPPPSSSSKAPSLKQQKEKRINGSNRQNDLKCGSMGRRVHCTSLLDKSIQL